MFNKLEEVERKFQKLERDLQNPSIIQDNTKYQKLLREHGEMEPLVSCYQAYIKAKNDLESSKEILKTESDEEMRELAKLEVSELEVSVEELTAALKIHLLPKDPKDNKNIILELRAGAGGDEAGLFAEELFRGYSYYASKNSWKVEVLSTSPGAVGGYKEVIASISGDKVYSKLKYESGVHRVQRVPKTESQGRVHTSTITVAVVPEAEAVDVDVQDKDLRIDVFRSSGSGGQHVNTTDSAVRITHVPTGVVVSCQDEKSQTKNKAKAMKVLYSRLLAHEEEKAVKEASDTRLSQIGTGDRSERIRTYNFPQTRVTDHRVGLTLHKLDEVMGGDFDLLLGPLAAHYQAEMLQAEMSD
ncbi:MAG: peptide chain release factor 1 [Bdellovibrionales bacterium]